MPVTMFRHNATFSRLPDQSHVRLLVSNECASKQKERQDPAFKANEIIYQRESKQNKRQDSAVEVN